MNEEDRMNEDDEEDGMLDGDSEKTQKKKRREKVFLEYILLFQSTNVMNLEKAALGGLDYKEVDWWIEMETFSTFMFNIWRYNL